MSAAAKFAVDEKGLAQILERRGKSYAILELLANAYDTAATWVSITLTPIEGRPQAELIVEDDAPEGWADLSHAYTLFAPSIRKSDPGKRGRFNLGEKLVLSICDEAEIVTTSGGIRFDGDGRHSLRRKREVGSQFRGVLKLARQELADLEATARKVIAPIPTTLNGVPLPTRMPLSTLGHVPLLTEFADGDGYLRRSVRHTDLAVYEPLPGETATLYEQGIPVMESEDDRYHYDVRQKVPLGMERDAVPPSFMRAVRVHVLNVLHREVAGQDAVAPWVRDAMADERIEQVAVSHVMTERYGEKRVIVDPSDPEGTKLAMSKGYTVIPAGAMSKEEWGNVKRYQAALPAGQVTPSPKAFSDSPDAENLKTLAPDKWTDDIRTFVERAKLVALGLIDARISVEIASDIGWAHGAAFGPSGRLTVNLGRLGHRWFRLDNHVAQNALLIHEFAHYTHSDHLSSGYHDKLCDLGAKLGEFAVDQPRTVRP